MSQIHKYRAKTFNGFIYASTKRTFHLHYPDGQFDNYQLYSTSPPVFFSSVRDAEFYIQLLGYEIE